jgi:hypothetical protein
MAKGKNSMLAVLGFGFTGILFIFFALSIGELSDKVLKDTFKAYSRAYLLVAVAFIIWCLASIRGDKDILALSVVVGDALLLIATLLIISILFDASPHRKLWLYGAALTGTAALVIRTVFFYPEPFMRNHVLFFNSQRAVSFTIAATFLLIWWPVNLQIARLVTRKVQSLATTYTALYAVATLSAVIFLLAKTPLSVSLSFSALSVSFLALVISCKYVKLIEGKADGKRTAKS